MSLQEEIRAAAKAVIDAKHTEDYEVACEEFTKLATPANVLTALTLEIERRDRAEKAIVNYVGTSITPISVSEAREALKLFRVIAEEVTNGID